MISLFITLAPGMPPKCINLLLIVENSRQVFDLPEDGFLPCHLFTLNPFFNRS